MWTEVSSFAFQLERDVSFLTLVNALDSQVIIHKLYSSYCFFHAFFSLITQRRHIPRQRLHREQLVKRNKTKQTHTHKEEERKKGTLQYIIDGRDNVRCAGGWVWSVADDMKEAPILSIQRWYNQWYLYYSPGNGFLLCAVAIRFAMWRAKKKIVVFWLRLRLLLFYYRLKRYINIYRCLLLMLSVFRFYT